MDREKLPGRGLRAALFLCSALVAAAPAGAQDAAITPPITREEIERPLLDRREPPRARLEVEGGIERAPCALDRPEYESVRFTPRDVRFQDLRGLPAEALRAAYAPYLGREQPISVICEIRDRAATILRDAGYIASVEVPQQRIADGVVTFQVFMAKLVGLRVRGDAGRAERLIAAYLERLTEHEVFNRHDAERYLLLAGDIPGYSVRLNLRSAGAARGEVIGEVTVLHVPVLADVNVQNFGSRELGRFGILARGQFFGLTGLGDRTVVSLFTTADFQEQQTLQLAHDFTIGSQGLTLGGELILAWADPSLGPALDVEARTLFATFEAAYPIVRRQDLTLRARAGLEIVDQDVDFGSGAGISRDRLRVAFAGLELDAADTEPADPRFTILEPRWRLSASLEARRGLDIFGASPNCVAEPGSCQGVLIPSRTLADPTATVFRASAYGEYRPVPRVTAALGIRAQHASEALLAFEEFSVGNYTIGRGYDPGSIVGDRGLALQAEARFGSLAFLNRRGFAVEPFVFIDQAWVANEDPLIAGRDDEELTSIGAGLRGRVGDWGRLDLILAIPLDRVGLATERPNPRILVSFTTRLWPWSF